MRNLKEAKRRMIDAEDCLRIAEQLFLAGLYRGCIQNSQGCVELCAKAVISVFEEPDWTHNPERQLKTIIKRCEKEINKLTVEGLTKLALDVSELAPWHGRTLYGQNMGEEVLSAVELCNRDKAEWALTKARMGFETTSKFLANWFEKS